MERTPTDADDHPLQPLKITGAWGCVRVCACARVGVGVGEGACVGAAASVGVCKSRDSSC